MIHLFCVYNMLVYNYIDSAPITIQQHEEEQRQQTQTEFMTSSHVELLSHFTNTVRKERMEEQNRSDGNTTLSQPITTSLAKLASASCANTSSVHSTQIPTQYVYKLPPVQ